VHRGEESDCGCRYEARHRARHAEEQQSEPPQDPHQSAAREIQPMQDALEHDAAGVPLLGDLIMRKPALLLAEFVGHSRHQMLRPHDLGLGGRNWVERIACTAHAWCSLLGARFWGVSPSKTPLVSLRPKFLTPNHSLRSWNPPLKPLSRGRIAE